eukprot:145243-Pyramimonas_sp.AAC.1
MSQAGGGTPTPATSGACPPPALRHQVRDRRLCGGLLCAWSAFSSLRKIGDLQRAQHHEASEA